MKKLTIFIIFFIFKTNVFSQKLDFTQVEIHSYLRTLCYSDIFVYSSVISVSEYCTLLENSERIFHVEKLKSNGIEKLDFYLIKAQPPDSIKKFYLDFEGRGIQTIRTQYLFGGEYFLYPNLLKNSYIVAISQGQIYKLQGFKVSQYFNFFTGLFNSEQYINYSLNKKRSSRNEKRFLKGISIENVDLFKFYELYRK